MWISFIDALQYLTGNVHSCRPVFTQKPFFWACVSCFTSSKLFFESSVFAVVLRASDSRPNLIFGSVFQLHFYIFSLTVHGCISTILSFPRRIFIAFDWAWISTTEAASLCIVQVIARTNEFDRRPDCWSESIRALERWANITTVEAIAQYNNFLVFASMQNECSYFRVLPHVKGVYERVLGSFQN